MGLAAVCLWRAGLVGASGHVGTMPMCSFPESVLGYSVLYHAL